MSATCTPPAERPRAPRHDLARKRLAAWLALTLAAACAADGRSEHSDGDVAPSQDSDGAARPDATRPPALSDAAVRRDASLDAATRPTRDGDVGSEPSEMDAATAPHDGEPHDAEPAPVPPNEGPRDAATLGRDANQDGEANRDGRAAKDAQAEGDAELRDPDLSDATTDASTPDLPIEQLVPRLVESHYEGELCPPDSLGISAADDHSALTVVFSADVQADGSDTPVEKGCTVRLGFELPAGYALGNLHVYAQGYAWGTLGSAELSLSLAYRDQQAKQRASFMRLMEDYVVYERFDDVWSPSCGVDRRVDLLLEVDGRVRGDQLLTLSALDVGFQYGDGAGWKRCDTGELARPPPSRAGGSCGGPAHHPCADGLHCDILDERSPVDDLLGGVCVDPKARTAPAAKGERCGGIADISCASGLRCHHTSEAREALDTRGWCTPNVGRADDRCAGFPELGCAEGHFCSKQARNRCVASDGSAGARCEEGVLACEPGLQCDGMHCEPVRVGRGEPCGGAEGIRCTTLHICDVQTLRCIPEPNAGMFGGSCGSNVPCADGLHCVERTCVAVEP